MATEPVFTRTTKIWIDPEGIVHIESKAGVDERLEDAKENVNAVNTLVGSGSPLLLIDVRKLKSIERSAREYYAMAPDSSVRAMAMLVDSTVSRVIGNFVLGSYAKTRVPTRLFTDERQAATWLKGFSG
jgi:hypothetical protein